MRGVTIRGNRFYDMGRFDIDPWQIPANKHGRGSGAIGIVLPGGGHQIYNNLFYHSGPPSGSAAGAFIAIRIGLQADSTTTALIYNNTFYDFFNSNAISVRVEPDIPPTNVEIRNNIFFRAGAIEGRAILSHNLASDPLFVNAAAGDFRLRSGSPARDRGTSLSQVPTDFTGRRRLGTYDIGAFEYLGAESSIRPMTPAGLRVR